MFTERAFPSQLTPNRDLGIHFSGDIADGRASYAIGVLNGVSVNGYPGKTVRASVDYVQKKFNLAPVALGTVSNPLTRQDENAILTRLQLTF